VTNGCFTDFFQMENIISTVYVYLHMVSISLQVQQSIFSPLSVLASFNVSKQIGEAFETWAVGKLKESTSQLLALRPKIHKIDVASAEALLKDISKIISILPELENSLTPYQYSGDDSIKTAMEFIHAVYEIEHDLKEIVDVNSCYKIQSLNPNDDWNDPINDHWEKHL
jgi:hypothetical protein